MGGGSSDSSSSSSSVVAKKKKKKNEKKDKKSKKDKKAKKEKKDAGKKEKQQKRVAAAEEWHCDRCEAVRLIKQLLELDSGVADDLESVFNALDTGEIVRIEGLDNQQVKKKLRHLLKALRLSPAEGQAFKTADKKVSFTALFHSCLAEAKPKGSGSAAAAPVKRAVAPVIVVPEPEPVAAVPAPPVEKSKFLSFGDADGAVAEADVSVKPPAALQPPRAKRVKGPQLPGAGIGPAGGEDDDSEPEDEQEDGPRTEGLERQGVDLNSLDEQGSMREEWMTKPHESMAGAFMDVGAANRKDKYQVGRTKEETEAFEKLYKERGPSLLQQQAEGKFAAAKEEQEAMRKRKHNAGNDVWGISEKDQEKGSAAASRPAARKAFDPEKDMKQMKPMTTTDFSKLVENSGAELNGRFSRGGMATSFL